MTGAGLSSLPPMTILRAAWLSNIGNVRKENEDRILFDEQAQLFGVADGVGGLPGGAEAAQKTVDVVTAAVVEADPGAERDPRAEDKPHLRDWLDTHPGMRPPRPDEARARR